MFNQSFVKALKGTLHLLKGTALATAATLFGVVVSSCPANAQATYTYTGKPFTYATGSYTTSQRVTATLQLSAWLPPNSDCLDVTQLPGFRLILNDGLQTLDSAALPAGGFNAIYAAVSTDASGQITRRWLLSLSHSGLEIGVFQIVSLGAPVVPTTCGPLNINAEADEGFFIIHSPFNVSESSVFNDAGVWSYPSPASLIDMLLNQIKLGVLPDIGNSISTQLHQIAVEIDKDNGNACQSIRALIEELNAQTDKRTAPGKNPPPDKKVNPAQADFILTTLTNALSGLPCKK
jgi:hypothetical protein